MKRLLLALLFLLPAFAQAASVTAAGAPPYAGVINVTSGTLSGITGYSQSSGTATFPAGSVSLPSVYFGSSTTTGFYQTTTNQIGATIAGTQRYNLNSSGLEITGAIGINTSPAVSNLLRISGAVGSGATQRGAFIDPTASTAATTMFTGVRVAPTMADGSGATYASVRHFEAGTLTKSGGSDTITQQSGFVATSSGTAALNVGFEGLLTSSGTTRYNLYMSGTAPNYLAGQLFVGHTASVTAGQANKVQVSGDGSSVGGLALHRYSADALGTRLEFAKSGNATIGGNTAVANNDVLGNINFLGADGTQYRTAAQIIGEVDGAVSGGGAADMPGRVRILLSPDGSATPAEVARFSSTTVTLSKPLISGGTAPTIGACGSSPSIAGSDNAMRLTVGTGGAATTCAATFSRTYTVAPVCVAQNNTDRVAYSIATTTTTVTITATAAFTAGSIFHVLCMSY